MKLIPLTQGKRAIVDDSDYEWLMAWKWHAVRARKTFYAARHSSTERAYMHRQILGLGNRSVETDHRNGNGLDNRRGNLRPASALENRRNKAYQGSRSGFKGVAKRVGARSRWQAFIRANGRQLHLGSYETPEEAARAYDAAARRHFGDFARVNFGAGA